MLDRHQRLVQSLRLDNSRAKQILPKVAALASQWVEIQLN
jgi:hypothetical protein